jgi:DNA-directed RNA polymerase subunit RPC12/RpoP
MAVVGWPLSSGGLRLMECPACGSTRVFPSRLRTILERLRQLTTGKEPHRCHRCGWRKWGEVGIHPPSPDVRPEDLRTGRRPQPVSMEDLDRLD